MLSSALRNTLKTRIGEQAVNNWFKQFKITQHDNNITLYLPSKFIQDWINTHYLDDVYHCLQELTSLQTINLQLDNDTSDFTDITDIPDTQKQLYTFDNFIIGTTNQMAYNAAFQICQNLSSITFNPLIIYGNPGVGKSHLLTAIANYVHKTHPQTTIFNTTSEKFVYNFIKALKNNNITQFKDELREASLFLLDDVQFIMGKDSSQAEFFETFNFLKENNCQIVLSSDKPPGQLYELEERLKSRLKGGLAVEIHQPDYELRFSILMNKSATTNIDKRTIEFIAQHIKGSPRDLEGIWTKLIAYTSWMQQPITIELIKSLFFDELNTNNTHITNVLTPEIIQNTVCMFYNISTIDIRSNQRLQHITKARHICMFFMKELLNWSASEIARFFYKRDHTSVLYVLEKIKDQYDKYAHDINTIKAKLQ